MPPSGTQPLGTLKSLFKSGKPVLSGWCAIGSPFSAEIMGNAGFDTVVVDTQHGLGTDETVVQCLTAITAGGAIPIVRTRWNEPASIMRALDFGALGIICPMINTAEQARAFVSACRYSPVGNRSFGPIRASVTHGADYYKNANDSIVTMAMIETQQGYDNAQEILAVEGLDGVFVGPNDLGVELGVGPLMDDENPTLDSAIETIATYANNAGKFAGIFTGSPTGAERRVGQGYRFMCAGNDGMYLKSSIATAYNGMKHLKA